MEWYHVLALIAYLAAFAAGVILVLRNAVIKPRTTALFLDADGTLLDFDRSEQAALRQAFETLGYPFGETTHPIYHEKNLSCWKALERGEITRDELKTKRFCELFDDLGLSGDADELARVYEAALSGYAFPYEGAEDACARLAKKYELYLVTNGTKQVQSSRLIQTEFPALFKAIYISEDVGYEKPDPRFFDRIFAEHPHLKRAQTLIVGDSLTSDIRGGINASIRTCWVNRDLSPLPEGVRVDLQISDITELEKVL